MSENNNIFEYFPKSFPNVEQKKSLASLSTFGIGGPADLYYKLTDIQEIPAIMEFITQHNIPLFVLGGGSNTIFADEGFRGLVLHLQAKKITHENDVVIAEAGALLSQVIQYALKQSLSGMEKMMGLPGTIGGAVRGNAGAFGTETKDIFLKALIYNKEKGLHEVDKNYFNFKYRFSTIKKTQELILKIYLKLEKKDTKADLAEALDIVKNRISKQPKGKCSGSFFKNHDPHDDKLKAGYLLDQVGCKGLQVGKAQVSLQHANWIMNLGGATQNDVLELKNLMQKRVKERFNILLEPEVQFVSETGFMAV